jgi:hypothetical protein
MLKKDYIKDALNTFGDEVVEDARKRLTQTKSNFSKDLYNSISHESVKVSNAGNIVSVTFMMEDYGDYQDQGVRGIGGVRKTTSKFKSTNNRGKLWKQKVKKGETPFSFKKDKPIPAIVFEEWAKAKGLNPFAVAISVWHQGLSAKKFFTNAFNEAFERLPDDLVEAFDLEIDSFTEFTKQ